MDNGTCTFFDPISTIPCENICTNYNLQGGGGGEQTRRAVNFQPEEWRVNFNIRYSNFSFSI